MTTLKIELTPETTRWLRDHLHDREDSACRDVHLAAKAALTAHEREEKRKGLGLPWELVQIDNGDPPRAWNVQPNDGCEFRGAYYTEATARLMAAAPDLAKRVEASSARIEELAGLVSPDSTEYHDACDDIGKNTEALERAGWL